MSDMINVGASQAQLTFQTAAHNVSQTEMGVHCVLCQFTLLNKKDPPMSPNGCDFITSQTPLAFESAAHNVSSGRWGFTLFKPSLLF